MNMLSTQKKDLQNQDLPLFRYIDTICKKHIELYHFTEISTPIIENAALFRTGTNYAHDAIQDILLFVEHKNKIEEGKLCLRAYLEPLMSQHFTRQEMSNTPIKVYTSGTIFKICLPMH